MHLVTGMEVGNHGMRLSQDLRDQVINAVARDGMGCREAARHFEVSGLAAIKWVQRYRRLGDRRNAGTGGHRASHTKPAPPLRVPRAVQKLGQHDDQALRIWRAD
jgi:transposase-like protein